MSARRIITFLFVALMLAAGVPSAFAGHDDSPAPPWGYRLGEGLRIADTRFSLGGYASLKYIDTREEVGVFKLDDLSLFVFGDIGEKWRFFSEFEEEEVVEVPAGGKATSREDWKIERFFFDHHYRDSLDVRIGKFLTPIGTWNEIHADPLVWTVSRPVVTEAAFPKFITGLNVYGGFATEGEEFAYSLVFQNNESIHERTGLRKTHMFYGGRLRWLASPSFELGVPVAYYRDLDLPDALYLTGLDFTYRASFAELRGEATLARVDMKEAGWSNEYGYYVQAACPVVDEKVFVVLRHEYFNSRGDGGDHKALSLGGAYKPLPQVVFKVEYQFRSGSLTFAEEEWVNDADRFLVGFSILL